MAKGKDIQVHKSSRTNTIVAGAVMGAIAGVIAAILLHRKAEREERESTLTAGEGIKLGLLIFGLLRAISALSDDDK